MIPTIESNVRGYCRSFPTTFCRAKGSQLVDEQGRSYIDFFSGAGALNFGHNHPALTSAVIDHISQDGLIHGMDMDTTIKRQFLNQFQTTILNPRHQSYTIQFSGPTGTNAVEAAIRLARKVTGRSLVLGFTHGYHGMTMGALSLTANRYYRESASLLQHHAGFLPFDGYYGPEIDTIDLIKKQLDDPSSGLDLPAAIILETIQGEGGINVASTRWLNRLYQLTQDYGILLIVDDIQVGVGRTGQFFSFEQTDLVPDIILLSKSISGLGLPLSLVLIKPDYDQWKPGEHTGTFRCNNLALVSATQSLLFWEDPAFHHHMQSVIDTLDHHLLGLHEQYPSLIKSIRGTGLIKGIEFHDPSVAQSIQHRAFNRGLIIETSGGHNHVLKLMPALTIDLSLLTDGLTIINDCIQSVMTDAPHLAMSTTMLSS